MLSISSEEDTVSLWDLSTEDKTFLLSLVFTYPIIFACDLPCCWEQNSMNSRDCLWRQFPAEWWVGFHVHFGEILQDLEIREQGN